MQAGSLYLNALGDAQYNECSKGVADMSQEKVDLKKEQKKNRKKLNRKAKIQRITATVCSVVVLLAACGWIGYSAYKTYEQSKAEAESAEAPTYTPVDLTAISDYVSTLNSEENSEE